MLGERLDVVRRRRSRSGRPRGTGGGRSRAPRSLPAGSRLAVGSSMTRIDGRIAMAHAIARRCCSPPDSVIGSRASRPAEADGRQRRRRSVPASRRGGTREVLEAQRHLVGDRRLAQLGLRVVEHHRDSARHLADRRRGRVRARRPAPPRSARPGSRWGTTPLRLRHSVVLPAPLAPTIPTSSPGRSRATRRAARAPRRCGVREREVAGRDGGVDRPCDAAAAIRRRARGREDQEVDEQDRHAGDRAQRRHEQRPHPDLRRQPQALACSAAAAPG